MDIIRASLKNPVALFMFAIGIILFIISFIINLLADRFLHRDGQGRKKR